MSFMYGPPGAAGVGAEEVPEAGRQVGGGRRGISLQHRGLREESGRGGRVGAEGEAGAGGGEAGRHDGEDEEGTEQGDKIITIINVV